MNVEYGFLAVFMTKQARSPGIQQALCYKICSVDISFDQLRGSSA